MSHARLLRPATLWLSLLLGAAGCDQRLAGGDGEFLRLQGFTDVDPNSGQLTGFLRWVFLDADPSEVQEPGTRCEIWERLELGTVAVEPACPGCDFQFEGQATLDDDTDCAADVADWNSREFTLAFGPLAGPDEIEALDPDQFTHAVSTRWSPDLGVSDGFQTLFGARPDAWSDGPEGSGTGDPLEGQHELYCAFFWDLSE